MITLLVHIQVHPERAARFEEILRDMVTQTKSREPACLAYEYYRGEAPFSYYCRLAFASKIAFYEHQNSEYHEGYLAEFAACFASVRLEYLDPVGSGGSMLGATEDTKLPPDADAALVEAERKYPIAVQDWWEKLAMRSA
jgi:quinol monooxygenase YgiN